MKSTILVSLLLLATSATAQTKQIRDLRNQKAQLERGIKQSQTQLERTRHQADKKEKTADFIEDQLKIRLDYIGQLETEIDSLNKEVERLEQELGERGRTLGTGVGRTGDTGERPKE